MTRWGLALVLALGAGACGGDKKDDPAPEPAPATPIPRGVDEVAHDPRVRPAAPADAAPRPVDATPTRDDVLRARAEAQNDLRLLQMELDSIDGSIADIEHDDEVDAKTHPEIRDIDAQRLTELRTKRAGVVQKMDDLKAIMARPLPIR